MSKRIDTTLTDAEWAAIIAAVALAEAEWDAEDTPGYRRQVKWLNAGLDKLWRCGR